MIEGTVEKVAHNEIVEVMEKMKLGKATGTSEVNVEMIVFEWRNWGESDNGKACIGW